MVRFPIQFPEDNAPGSTPRQIILTLILPERGAKINLFFQTAIVFSKKKNFFCKYFFTFSSKYHKQANLPLKTVKTGQKSTKHKEIELVL